MAVRRRIRDWFVPFHWPGRDRRFLSALPAGELRRYNLLWLGRGRSWAGVGGMVGLVAVAVTLSFAPAHGGAWSAAGAAVAAAYWVVFTHFESRLRRRLVERDHPTLCRSCGYDLRGSPDRCPECGTVPA